MIKDITIGQYFNGNSLLHRLDARMKIILTVIFIVSIFLCQNFWSLGLMLMFTLVTVTISRVPLKMVLKSIKPIAIIVVFTSLLNIFYITISFYKFQKITCALIGTHHKRRLIISALNWQERILTYP